MKNPYLLRVKADKAKVVIIAETIFQEKDKLITIRNIPWEVFTQEYLKLPLPITEIERIQWVNSRPIWVEAVNKQFLKNGYPCQLQVIYGIGVCLLVNGQAVRSTISKRTKKIANVSITTIEACEALQNGFPEASKLIDAFQKMTIDNLYAFSGRIDNSHLPREIKRELKSIVQRGLPQSDDL